MQDLVLVADLAQLAQQRVARTGRVAQLEGSHHLVGQPAVVQVGARQRPFLGLQQLLGKEAHRVLVQLHQQRPQLRGLCFFRRARAPLRQRHPDLVGHRPQRLREGEFVDLHHKLEDVAAHAAAEAVVELLDRMDGKRGGLLRVERAQTHEVLACLLQAHVVAHNADYVRLLLDLLRYAPRLCH